MPEKQNFTVRIQKVPESGRDGQCLELPSAISERESIEKLKNTLAEAILFVLESLYELKNNEKLVIEISHGVLENVAVAQLSSISKKGNQLPKKRVLKTPLEY